MGGGGSAATVTCERELAEVAKGEGSVVMAGMYPNKFYVVSLVRLA